MTGECVKTRKSNSIKPDKKDRVPTIEKCKGCNRTEVINDQELCLAYLTPSEHWRLGNCPLATHVITMVGEQDQGKTRAGQQKQKGKKR